MITLEFGRVVRRLRKDAGLSQVELGRQAGLQGNYISSLELGEKQPTITSIFKIANALKMKPGNLITLVDEAIAGQELVSPDAN
ncbi:MAG: helix-turn-helix transcriptional regulator [Lacisediminimonas sp.]|nr:helix-turn-helix transcriptional regulator [Lacisediminimonas sp.]MDO8299222.1 helix-turn-helix transcriptional regulator [Lacisediminimonas sp.]